jgi:phenylacetyl-CoA:acceptor oxidoreductase subunit 2
VLAAVRAGAWYLYRAALGRDGVPAKSLAVLQQAAPVVLIGGGVLPVGIAVLGLALPAGAILLCAFAGLCAAAAGAAFKFVLVTRAGYNQGFALTHTPVRGSGVPGPGVKPGWVIPK